MATVCKRDPSLHSADHRILWRKLITECVFKWSPQPARPRYWLIDALEECKQDKELVPYLLEAAVIGGVRVFLTSRTSFESYGISQRTKSEAHVDANSEETTNLDIELYLRQNKDSLPTRDQEYTARLLLAKSNGCFLWTKLALDELRQGLTRSGIRRILDEVPMGMDDLYDRIIRSMVQNSREPSMIDAILEWTTCAIRPLSTEELYHGLRIDMRDEIDGDIVRFVEANCGQLIVVANGRVRMVHTTAREYLFSDRNEARPMSRSNGHMRLAMACLKYLTGPEMVGGAKSRRTHQTSPGGGPFVAYAATALFEHINFVRSEEDEFAAELRRFLKSPNVLSWIEYLARHSDLGRLVQSGTALRQYAARRAKKTLLFGSAGKDNELFDKWATDMVRLVTKFGSYLRESPASTIHLLPPFCPHDSAIRTQFANSNRSIKVNGMLQSSWDDCASAIVLQDMPNAVASAPDLFAIGLQNGSIVIYDENICQEVKSLDHGEPVKKLLFGTIEPLLIAGGSKSVPIWDTNTWTLRWSYELTSSFFSLALTANDQFLMVTCRSNDLHMWETDTGVQHPAICWLDEEMNDGAKAFRRPITTAISADGVLLAVANRGEDIVIWDTEQMQNHDVLGRDEGSHGRTTVPRKGVSWASSMIFSKGSDDSRLLVVRYNDGIMNLFDAEQGVLKASTLSYAHTLASSNDGLTIACGDSGGIISLYEFDALKLLYRIQTDQTMVRQLSFSADDQRILGVQSHHCYLWDPPVLVRQSIDEANSDTISASTAPQEFKAKDIVSIPEITSVAVAESGKTSFCGKADGSICLYNPLLGEQISVLLRHAVNTQVVELIFDSVSSVLVTVDVSSRVMAHSLDHDATKVFILGRCLIDRRIGTAVTQVLLNRGSSRLLISTELEDMVIPLQTASTSSEQIEHHEIRTAVPSVGKI